MTPLLSLGIDPSIAATGLVLLRSNETPTPDVMHQSEVTTKNLGGINRAKHIVLAIMTVVHEYKPDKIIVEGYSLNMMNKSSVVPLVELGGLLRFMLMIDGLTWIDPRASQLKQFATGKGNSPKEKIMLDVYKRWGFDPKTNNIADAYVLAAMGLAHSRRLPGITKDMQKIVGEILIRRE